MVTKRAFWLIKLRWFAIICVIIATIFSKFIFKFDIRYFEIFIIAVILAAINFISLFTLKKITRRTSRLSVKLNINFQIFIDFLALSLLLHYSGSFENPFILFYIFHMIIASIILSRAESYVHTTVAVLLFTCITLLEFDNVIPHYPLIADNYGIISSQFVFASILIFAITSYLIVYLTGTLAMQNLKQQQQILEANMKLNEKDAIKNEYVLRVTHDIKGHLSAIQSCLSVVKSKLYNEPEKNDEFVKLAYNRTVNVSDFVQDLLRLTRMRLNDEIEKEYFSLHTSIKSIIETLDTNAKSKNQQLLFTSSCECLVLANKFSIEDVISNLILNAIKYTHENGRIDVYLRNYSQFVLVEIIDTGYGIPKDEIPKIFDEFFRASNVKKVIRDGTGLGLSLVKQIIERHNGKIWVESELNNGSKFSFIIPKNG